MMINRDSSWIAGLVAVAVTVGGPVVIANASPFDGRDLPVAAVDDWVVQG